MSKLRRRSLCGLLNCLGQQVGDAEFACPSLQVELVELRCLYFQDPNDVSPLNFRDATTLAVPIQFRQNSIFGRLNVRIKARLVIDANQNPSCKRFPFVLGTSQRKEIDFE